MEKPEGRYVVEIPLRLSAADERRALARTRTAQQLANEILAEYLARAQRYLRDRDLIRLKAELREARRDGRAITCKPETAAEKRSRAPRNSNPVVLFADPKERAAAWSGLQQKHGLIGDVGNARLTPEGLASHCTLLAN